MGVLVCVEPGSATLVMSMMYLDDDQRLTISYSLRTCVLALHPTFCWLDALCRGWECRIPFLMTLRSFYQRRQTLMYGHRTLVWQRWLAFVSRDGRADCSTYRFELIEEVCETSGDLVSRRRLCTRTRWAAAIRGRGHFYINTAAGVVVNIVVVSDA
jgi:hypothetical protein